MQIQPKPAQTPTAMPPAVKHPTLAGMPDRASPEWGKAKPQPAVKTSEGELAPIPKHPAQMTEGELHQRYFAPGYAFDIATGKSPEPFFTGPGRFVESPTRETPPPKAAAPLQTAPGLWGGAAPVPRPIAQRPKPDSSAEEAPLLPHERFDGPAAPPARPAARDDYFGSDWD